MDKNKIKLFRILTLIIIIILFLILLSVLVIDIFNIKFSFIDIEVLNIILSLIGGILTGAGVTMSLNEFKKVRKERIKILDECNEMFKNSYENFLVEKINYLDINDIKKQKVEELKELCAEMNIESPKDILSYKESDIDFLILEIKKAKKEIETL